MLLEEEWEDDDDEGGDGTHSEREDGSIYVDDVC